jgi:hypothetical protein
MRQTHSFATKFKAVILAVILTGLIVSLLSSCKTSGYGCKGKESWGRMVKRINNGY